MIKLRSATPDDTARVTEIARAAYGAYVDRIGATPAPLTTDYGERIASAHVDLLIDGDSVIGFVITVMRAQDLLLENVALAPEAQGKGYGRLLISAAEDLARAAGRDRVVLYTHVLMTENRTLYQRLGYAEVEQRLEHGLHRVYMEKRLTA